MTLRERFEDFHAANPHVYAELLRLAREAKARGQRRIGAKALWERMRWELGVDTSGDAYRLNNSLVSLYVRRLIANEPDLAELFELRTRRSS